MAISTSQKESKNNIDAFRDIEFSGHINSIPILQFINPKSADSEVWGIGMKKNSATLAGFKGDESWQLVSHKFGEEKYAISEEIYVCKQPRLIVLNPGKLLMRTKRQGKLVEFDSELWASGEFDRILNYMLIWPVGKNNELLSEKPFRLACTGKPGTTFRRNFYSGEASCFTKQFLGLYQEITEDNSSKNWLFFAHVVAQPQLDIESIDVSDKQGNKSTISLVVTKGFVPPTLDNCLSIAIENNSPLSVRIREAIAQTASWLPVPVPAENFLPRGNTNSTSIVENETKTTLTTANPW